jgi:hypothetical protein
MPYLRGYFAVVRAEIDCPPNKQPEAGFGVVAELMIPVLVDFGALEGQDIVRSRRKTITARFPDGIVPLSSNDEVWHAQRQGASWTWINRHGRHSCASPEDWCTLQYRQYESSKSISHYVLPDLRLNAPDTWHYVPNQ